MSFVAPRDKSRSFWTDFWVGATIDSGCPPYLHTSRKGLLADHRHLLQVEPEGIKRVLSPLWQDQIEVFVMTVKELAYTVQRHIQDAIGMEFKRSHAYELLSAAYGFRSFASIPTDCVFSCQTLSERWPSDNEASVRLRCHELGLSADQATSIAHTLPRLLELNQIGITKISTLYAYLRQTFPEYSADSDDFDDADEWQEALEDHAIVLSELANSSLLYAEVTRAADKGVQYAAGTLNLMRVLRKAVDANRST